LKKELFRIEGGIENPQDYIEEYIYSSSGAQALKVVAIRLQKKYGKRVYIGNCSITKIPRNSGRK